MVRGCPRMPSIGLCARGGHAAWETGEPVTFTAYNDLANQRRDSQFNFGPDGSWLVFDSTRGLAPCIIEWDSDPLAGRSSPEAALRAAERGDLAALGFADRPRPVVSALRRVKIWGSSGFRCERCKTAAGVPPSGGIAPELPPEGGTPARSPIHLAPKPGRAKFGPRLSKLDTGRPAWACAATGCGQAASAFNHGRCLPGGVSRDTSAGRLGHRFCQARFAYRLARYVRAFFGRGSSIAGHVAG